MPLQPGTTIGPYEITGWIGAGGMGEVYRARDPRLGRDVAIKMIAEGYAADLGRVQRFEQEARSAGQINHPNILAVHDAGISEGRPFIVSELLEGQSLRERLRHGALPLRKTIEYARQIAEGLAAAHDKSIVHRDLKPDNIFVSNDGRIKILDFGLAKLHQPDGGETRASPANETEPGTILGTAGYMSPEQVRGEAVDVRSDLFSFGTIMYEMLAGRAPFARNTPIETMTAILTHDPMPAIIETIPMPVEKLVSRCLEKIREARFQSARDLAFGIEMLSTSGTSSVSAAGRPFTASVVKPATIALLGFAMLAAVVLAARYRPAAAPAPVVPMRMTVDLGSGGLLPTTLAQFGDVAAISPDGSLIAFTAQKTADDSRMQLYLRSLSELQAKPISGTEQGEFPFFSPDGRWIGFFSDGKLMKVPASGGPIQTLADASDPRGGSWGSDGTIVFSPDRLPGTVLWRVNANGGAAVPLTTLAAGESIHAFPQLLPDGKSVLFTGAAIPGSYNDANLVVQSLETGARKIIQSGGYHGRIAGSDHLLFIRDGTLMAAPFDLQKLEVLRPPVAAVDGVRGNTITGGAQFSVSTSGVLAYLSGPSVGGSTPMQLMDRQSVLTPLKGEFGNWLEVRFSPDGSRVLMLARSRQPGIWTYDLGRETLTRLTADATPHSDPVWSADGSRIAFASHPDGQPIHMEWRPADGSRDAQRILHGARNQTPSAFDPSGRFLVYCEFSNETEIDLMVVPIDGSEAAGWTFGEPRQLTHAPGREVQATFSPDGRWIAYVGQETGRPEVLVQPFPEMNRRWQVSNEGGFFPTWSRTKPEIIYSQDGQLKSASYTVHGDVFESARPRPWADGRVAFRGPSRMFDLHPDGNRVVLAPAPSAQASESARVDKIVLVFNFFDELRRLAPR